MIGDALDPEEIIEFVHWLEEEDLVFKVLGEMLSVGVAHYPLVKQEVNCVGLE